MFSHGLYVTALMMLLIAFQRCRKSDRGYFVVLFRGVVGMSLNNLFMRLAYTELLQSR